MKLWYQSMTDLDEYPDYAGSLVDEARRLLPTGVEVTVHGVRPGTYGAHAPIEVLVHPYAKHVVLGQIPGQVERARDQGYDGFVIGSFSEPLLREIRSLAVMPVTSMAEATLHMACSYGGLIGLVSITEAFAYDTRRLVESHGLSSRLGAVTVLEPEVTEDVLESAFDQPDQLLEHFDRAARRLVGEHQVDVVVPAEGVLNQFLARQRVRSVAGATVMDTVAATLLQAYSQVRLAQVHGIGVSQRWEYPRPDDDVLALVRDRRVAGTG